MPQVPRVQERARRGARRLVALEDHPSGVAGVAECRQHSGSVDETGVAPELEEPAFDLTARVPLQEVDFRTRKQVALFLVLEVGVLEMDVPDAGRVVADDRDRVDARHDEIRGAERQVDEGAVGELEQPRDAVGRAEGERQSMSTATRTP
ncbi:hypothetical protein GCM10025866_00220 [Naasia aerilata]|uniref:Uncharacterized protein n=1 Tax=Naasia aerilata TaxID=1162966 RepID=A0ABN6XGV0_9MICO|nr:hypothetical protein GCM10025866_00220 [Naasia aerilata]